jgi:Rad3-related DNA helicase
METSVNIFGTKGPATDYFVGTGYRPHQRETIEEIEAAFEQGFRYVVIDAPTGSGKSHVARAFAFQAASTHLVTVQKLLQGQYQRDFQDMFIMMGRSAFACIEGEAGDSCANGPCRRKKMAPNPNCPYQVAKGKAMSAPVTVHNFDSFFYQNSYGNGYGGRKLLIVDEAHNIPGKFTDFLSFTINSRGGIIVPEAYTLQEYDNFVGATKAEYQAEYDSLQRLYNDIGLDDAAQLKKMQGLGSLLQKMGMYLFERQKEKPTEFVFDFKSKGHHGPNVTFRPVSVGKFASRWLFNYGERVILMSATILDKEMFCKEVGLNPSETYYVNVPSTFPPENRPIIKKYAGKMSYHDIDDTLPHIVECVQFIVDRFPDRKGIIQTHSEKIASYLQRNLFDSRFTFNKNFPRPQDMLESHKRKVGSFIVASGLREGLDLYGDLSQIQVFCKIPYPSMGDKVVKRKMELDANWYGWITTVMFIQALGRSVRSPKEKAVTYILDSGFGWFYKRNRKFIPDYIKDAIKE